MGGAQGQGNEQPRFKVVSMSPRRRHYMLFDTPREQQADPTPRTRVLKAIGQRDFLDECWDSESSETSERSQRCEAVEVGGVCVCAWMVVVARAGG